MGDRWGIFSATAALLLAACGGDDPLGVSPGTPDAGAEPPATLAKFSFFYTSLDAMRRLSGSANGFGGDLRYGTGSGLTGADKICQTIAADVDAGFGAKTWRAFLSVVAGPDGQPVHAIDRVGNGPWYDETGQGTRRLGDTHDVITGSNRQGQLRSAGNPSSTCQDWTSASTTGQIGVGHSWPAGSGRHWIEAHSERSCAPGVNLVQNGPGNQASIGSGGGWGGFYCFALTP